MRTRLVVICVLVFVAVSMLAGPAAARHGETPGGGQECNGINVAKSAIDYGRDYCNEP